MGALFRGKFLAGLNALKATGAVVAFDDFRDPQAFDRLMARLARKRWIVYAKRPFGGAENVVSYLGRYTHRVGISNQRLLSRRGEAVTFATKNGATTTIPGVEFLRRFTQHVLPKGFVKIRHYGLYSSSHVKTRLLLARDLVATSAPAEPHSDALLPDWKAVVSDRGVVRDSGGENR
jgi:Putative transposase